MGSPFSRQRLKLLVKWGHRDAYFTSDFGTGGCPYLEVSISLLYRQLFETSHLLSEEPGLVNNLAFKQYRLLCGSKGLPFELVQYKYMMLHMCVKGIIFIEG